MTEAMAMRGHLIVVEGIDGSGKSTLVRALSDRLAARLTREPTSGPHGTALRQAFARGQRLSPEDERVLVEADRREHIEQLLAPALAHGETVVCDRSYYSTAAYQGTSLEQARSIVRDNEAFALKPDIVVFLDIPAVFALARIQARGGKPTAPETYEFLRDCAARYEAVWADQSLMTGITFVRIDARQPFEAVATSAREAVDAALARHVGPIAGAHLCPQLPRAAGSSAVAGNA